MKRLLILASAAIVALASCSKTQVVYKGAPEEIGFKAVNMPMTKAVTEWTTDSGIMGLFAEVTGADPVETYLDNVQFKKQGESFLGWNSTGTGSHEPYYWPLGKNLDFVVYAPYTADAAYAFTTTKVLTIPVDNTGENQTDILYGAVRLDNKAKQAEAYAVTMKHALAWIQVNIKADQAGVLTVNSLDLTDIVKSGTLNVNYATAATPSVTWTNQAAASDLALFPADEAIGTEYSTADFLIIPANTQTEFEMTYKLGTNTGLTWETNLDGSWVAGNKYIYNIEVGASEIKINPSVEPWTPVSDTPDPHQVNPTI